MIEGATRYRSGGKGRADEIGWILGTSFWKRKGAHAGLPRDRQDNESRLDFL